MIVVNYEKELREAFAAGQHSMLPKLMKGKITAENARWFSSIPKTFEEWIERQRDRPQIVRG